MGRIIFSLLSTACLMAGLATPAAALAADPVPPTSPTPAEAEQIKQEIRDRLRQERELRTEIRDRMMRLPPQDREVVWNEINPRRGPPPGFGPTTGAGPSGFGQGFEGRAPASPRR
jgi:hypothetical protein